MFHFVTRISDINVIFLGYLYHLFANLIVKLILQVIKSFAIFLENKWTYLLVFTKLTTWYLKHEL